MFGSLNLFRILGAAAPEPRRMHGLPSLAQDQGNERQGRHRVGPRLVPNCVRRQARKGNPRHVAAEGRFRSIRLQGGARRDGCQVPFPAAEPRHCNGGGQQDSHSHQTLLRFAISGKVQNGSQHHESRQREKQRSGNPGGTRLVGCEPKPPKDNRCGEQLDQAVPTESKQSRAVGIPSRPERKCCLQRHPQNCEYLKPENTAGDICQRGWTRNGHLIVYCTPDRRTPGFRADFLEARQGKPEQIGRRVLAPKRTLKT